MHKFPVWQIGGLQIDLSTFLTIIIACLIVFILARLSVRNLSVNNPSKLQNFMEWVVEFVQGIIASAMPLDRVKPFVSLGMTIIMFIFVSNLLGLPFGLVLTFTQPVDLLGYPLITQEMINSAHGGHGVEVAFWKSPTADVSVTFGLAVIVFILTHYLGLKVNTKHYLKHYFEPFWFFLPLNLIKEISKPLTLGLRLYANIFAGEVLIATILMAGIFGTPLLIAWQGFSIFVGAIQAFLFTILTMVYIKQASVHEEESH
ncbi:F-type H+-transporting ATPase subunit a [Paenibacillus sp. UNCCL117]|uniref:F0F1 ATP synthase subunit A n=1 Tax=unclassified Paenibacillus TaxID=185978 RepID=UPI000882AA7E|nr:MULTISPECIES: F0F1 ATP synthase subunit A [unclassified Paenibacillus]SDE33723.1 F-type H+-transporting ATPase subunit a [Paenibacillus sp. cl123]SFW64090.1 F-type H+-transporting ATPase subunit a [Paenibacillus sp. UNCCL117]